MLEQIKCLLRKSLRCSMKPATILIPNHNDGISHTKRIQQHEHVTGMEEDAQDLLSLNSRCKNCELLSKIKCIGVYHAWLVACGYSKVPRVNFSKNYSLDMNDITFYVQFYIVIQFQLLAKIVNIKIAFLYGDLKDVM